MFGIGKKKAQLQAFLEDKSVAVVHVYGDKVTIDGKKPNEFESMKGQNGEWIVKLIPGEHAIQAIHRTTNFNTNYKSKLIESIVPFDAGIEYSFGVSEYSLEYLEARQDDPAYQYVYYYPLEAKGKKFGITCFIEQ